MEFEKCPFCGRKEIIICTTNDLGMYAAEFGFFCVCDVNRGGCGAATGWSETKDEAINKWNKRVGNG